MNSRYSVLKLHHSEGAGMANGNGTNIWDYFWRALSVIAVPWAFWMSMQVVDQGKAIQGMKTRSELTHIEVERRLVAVEADTHPDKRFYRRDGEVLSGRVSALEELHPREVAQ